MKKLFLAGILVLAFVAFNAHPTAPATPTVFSPTDTVTTAPVPPAQPTTPVTPVTPVTPMPVTLQDITNTDPSITTDFISGTQIPAGDEYLPIFTPTDPWTVTIKFTCTETTTGDASDSSTVPYFALADTTTNTPKSTVFTEYWNNPTQELSGTITWNETTLNDNMQISTGSNQPCTWEVIVTELPSVTE